MRPHPRIRKCVMWTALAVGALFAVVFAASTHWNCSRDWLEHGQIRCLSIEVGVIQLQVDEGPVNGRSADPAPHWSWSGSAYTFIDWWPRPLEQFSSARGVIKTTFIQLPLWLPAFTLLGFAVLFSRLDLLATRRANHGACPSCGYSRSGLSASSPCPECGRAA